jgi:hypothetical protein
MLSSSIDERLPMFPRRNPMKRLPFLALVMVLAGVPACSGGDGGGQSSGGSAGNTSMAGATAGGGASAGTSTGGTSAGTAGSSTAGSSTAGTNGGGTAGSNMAGTSSGGGGAGGAGNDPQCTMLCMKKPIQICLGEYCQETCAQTRQQFQQFFPSCTKEYDAQFACINKQPDNNVMCDNNKITSPACTAEQAALMMCAQ